MSLSNPYEVNVPLETKPDGYRSPAGLVRFLTIGLRTYALLAGLLFLANLMYVIVVTRLLAGLTTFTGNAEDEELLQDMLHGLLAVFYTIVYWACIIASIIWINRTQKNLPTLGATGMTVSPGWAIGWFFVPIANYFKPYEAMKQLWQASQAARSGAPQSSWKGRPVPGFLQGWWALWVITSIIASITFRISLELETLEGFLAIGYVDLVLAPAEVVLALLYLRIVQGISENQEQASQSLAPEAVGFSPARTGEPVRETGAFAHGTLDGSAESRFPSTRLQDSRSSHPYGTGLQ